MWLGVLLLLNSTAKLVYGAKVYYVLPDDASSTTCPSQPCATLSEYLQDNSTLSFVSDVEYQLLPGEHRVTRNIDIHHVNSFKLSGNPSTSSKCDLGVFIRIQHSSNFTLICLSIRNCGRNTFKFFTSVAIQNCSLCNIVNVTIYPPEEYYSIAGINMIGTCRFDDLRIILNSSGGVCGKGIFLGHKDNDNSTTKKRNSLIIISNLNFSVKNSGCISYDKESYLKYGIVGTILDIALLQNQYAVIVEVHNSTFHDITYYDQPVMSIFIQNINLNYISFHNCTFSKIHLYRNKTISHLTQELPPVVNVIHINVMHINVAVKFTRCNFHLNDIKLINFHRLISIYLQKPPEPCETFIDTRIFIDSCSFSNNVASVLTVHVADKVLRADDYKRVVIHIRQTRLFNNTASTSSLLSFSSCSIVFSGNIDFLANNCDEIIGLSEKTRYIQVEEYANITFIDNKCFYLVSVDYNFGFSFDTVIPLNPYCLFQFISSNASSEFPPPTAHYNITVISDTKFKGITIGFDQLYSHCKWISAAVYYGYRPRAVNKQIIKAPDYTVDTIVCYQICLCSPDGAYNCTADVLGSVYPGQILTTSMFVLSNEQCLNDYFYHIYVASTIPKSHCKVITREEWISLQSKACNPINLTITSNTSKECEVLFVQPGISTKYRGFYVELKDCPVGFSLLNGICDCDPLLSESELRIRNCDIESVVITHPGNSWIYSQTMANNTKYFFAKCSKDYCVPQPLAINISNPDLQCQFNRSGTVCSQCKHGLSMVFGSSRCMKCNNAYLLISLIIIMAGIALVVLMYGLNLTVTSGIINGFILYANILSINDTVFLTNGNAFKPLKLFISFANLDLGIETCFYNGMDSYAKMWLQLFFPLYLIMMATLIIISSRHCYRIQRLTYTRSLPVLATLFLLSYMGILRGVSMVLFSYSTITELPSGNRQLVWSIDASIPLFGLKFSILFITCLVLFLILIPFNFILLFTRYLSKFKIINKFKPLLDTFQGPYKDGCYYWTAVHIIIRDILFGLYAINIILRLNISALLLVIFTMLTGYVQPYKNKFVNIQEILMLTNVSILYGAGASYQASGKIFYVTNNVMIASSLIHFCAIALYHFFMYTYHCGTIVVLLGGIRRKIESLLLHKKQNQVYEVRLPNIPERTHNYSEYREGLISDDFHN